MLLRRITEHVKAQNWFAVGLDFIIVVVGVFIGIQVANWNDVRRERLREDHYLERLDKEFDVIRERLIDGAAVFEASIRDIDALLTVRRSYKLTPEKTTVEDAALVDAIDNISSGRVPASSPAAFKEMVARGALESLTSDDLRHALFAFDEFSAVARDGWRTLRDGHLQATNAVWGVVDASAPQDLLDDDFEFIAFDRERFFGDPAMQNHLNIILRAQINQYQLINRQLELANEIEAIIATESK